MDWGIVRELIRPELLIVAAFLYCVGAFLRLLPVFRHEWAVPYILLGVSLAVTPLYMAYVLGTDWGAEMIVSGVIQAVLVAALCVFSNRLYTEIRNKSRKKDQG